MTSTLIYQIMMTEPRSGGLLTVTMREWSNYYSDRKALTPAGRISAIEYHSSELLKIATRSDSSATDSNICHPHHSLTPNGRCSPHHLPTPSHNLHAVFARTATASYTLLSRPTPPSSHPRLISLYSLKHCLAEMAA